MKTKAKVAIQMYDGDGVEPPEVMRARLDRERDERAEELIREKARYEAKRLRRALDYKESLKSHPLTVPAIKFQITNLIGEVQQLVILTTCPPESFNHILEIHRPKWTIRSPMQSYHHTVAQIEYPMVWIFHNPVARTYDWEEVIVDGHGRQKRDGWEKVYQHTLTFTCSKAQDHSARTYKKLKEIISGKISA
jgi:hypothetical protein